MPNRPPAQERVTLDATALKVLREKDGHSLSSLARLTTYTVSYINDLEKGRRKGNAGVIAELARALNVPKSMLEARRDTAA